MRKAVVLWVVLALAVALGGAWAVDSSEIGRAVLTTVGVGAVVKATAAPADKFINTAMQSRHMPIGTATKVVPVLSVGRKAYVGAMQVAGSSSLVRKARAVVQAETEFDRGRFRIKLLIPTESSNPLQFKRIPGLGATALVDVALSSNAYTVPNTRSLRAGDLLYGAAIGLAVKEFARPINDFINRAAGTQGGPVTGATKVVPYLSFGEKGYLGAMQVAGPVWAVSKVQAVWQYEDLFDRGRLRIRALVPTNSINPVGMKRISGVGCTAVIDAVVARRLERERHPERYYYRDKYPFFVGDEPERRPPGWDRGRKEGWQKHGNPYLPPGLSKKVPGRPGLVIPVPVQEEKKPAPKGEQPKPPGKGKPRGWQAK